MNSPGFNNSGYDDSTAIDNTSNNARAEVTNDPDAVQDLNRVLEHELAAADMYDQVLPKATHENLKRELEEVRYSHLQRIQKLQQEIRKYGGVPSEKADFTGAITKLLGGLGSAINDVALLTGVEEAEDIIGNDYEWMLVKMHGDYRKMLKNFVLPEQLAMRERLSLLVNSQLGGTWPPTPNMTEI